MKTNINDQSSDSKHRRPNRADLLNLFVTGRHLLADSELARCEGEGECISEDGGSEGNS